MPTQNGPIDFPDLRALKAGDLEAWRAAWASLWAVALQAARHPKAALLSWEAEDVASEAIEELILRIDCVSSVHHAKALLATIAARRAIDYARRKSAEKRCVPPAEQMEAFSSQDDPPCVLEQSEMVALVHEALEVLDADARLLLMQKIGQRLTYREISQQHNLPIGTVCTKVARALTKVRLVLQQSSPHVKELRAFLR
jgi:RNA polymerase sigma-70 factor (ECF subfamily)